MKSNRLSKEQIEDLIEECGSSPTFWRQDDMLICCPVHGESNPSMGISADKQVCHCFSCGFKGNFAWLLFKSQPDRFKSFADAEEYFDDRYELQHHSVSGRLLNISRYEDMKEESKSSDLKVLPLYTIAPFKSGKETYKYFFRRGFSSEDMKKFMIGRDLNSKTVTIPIFNEDKELVGVIGRFISKNRKHNERYKIYSFERGKITYPIDKYDGSSEMILVEGNFDAIRMFKLGYTNTQAIMSNNLTKEQAKFIADRVDSVIYVGDNDSRGLEAREENITLLKEYGVKSKIVDYPEEGKDPCDWSEEEIRLMIEGAHLKKRRIRRI